MQIMRFFKIPAALERIDEVVAEAQEYARTHRDVATRHDAWRSAESRSEAEAKLTLSQGRHDARDTYCCDGSADV